jgi:hypothetical protein
MRGQTRSGNESVQMEIEVGIDLDASACFLFSAESLPFRRGQVSWLGRGRMFPAGRFTFPSRGG